MASANLALGEAAIEPQSVPLTLAADGVLQVGETRVPLDCVVYAFEEGETPEGIVERFPALKIADVYQVIAYYLRHPLEIATYLKKQDQRTEEVRQWSESQFGTPSELRAQLLARQRSRQATD